MFFFSALKTLTNKHKQNVWTTQNNVTLDLPKFPFIRVAEISFNFKLKKFVFFSAKKTVYIPK